MGRRRSWKSNKALKFLELSGEVGALWCGSELGEKTLSAVKSGTMGDLSLCSVLSWVSFNNLWPMWANVLLST